MSGISMNDAHRYDETEGKKGYRFYRCCKCGKVDMLIEMMNTVCPVKGDA